MAFVEPSNVDAVLAIAEKWEIDASVVGEVTSGTDLDIYHNGELVAQIPAASLSEDAPRYDRPLGEPGWMEDLWSNTLTLMTRPGLADALLRMLDDPSIASPRWAYEQFDHMLFLNTLVGPGNDGSLLRIKGTDKALAVSTDGNGRLCQLDPWRGGARLVYEAALNVAMTGARPLAVVDNLNFGNPEKPDVMWQFRETVEGISDACERLGIPVVGGNVSFYNETDGRDIYPTPVVGLLGLADPAPANPPRLDRVKDGMELWLFGQSRAINLAGSAFEQITFGHVGGRPSAPDPTMAAAAIEVATALASEGLAPALHDISDGGLLIAMSEMCIASGVGVTASYSDWRSLFSEDPHRFVAAIPTEHTDRVAEIASSHGFPAVRFGIFGGTEISVERKGARAAVDLEIATETFYNAIPRRLG